MFKKCLDFLLLMRMIMIRIRIWITILQGFAEITWQMVKSVLGWKNAGKPCLKWGFFSEIITFHILIWYYRFMELNILKSLPDSQCYSDWSACESPRHLSKRKEICQWINCLLITLRVGTTITAHLGILTVNRQIVGMPFLLVVAKY